MLLCLFCHSHLSLISFFFFFNDTATTEIYTLSLHDALPISYDSRAEAVGARTLARRPTEVWTCQQSVRLRRGGRAGSCADRKSTRLNSSHLVISYAVFCLKKKKIKNHAITRR